ncbi:MAG: hypothetical protein MK078_16575 [Crocinitomicaceae bacterium]|nr:hypothetical protein [Crocinitomicaceae bacterium]
MKNKTLKFFVIAAVILGCAQNQAEATLKTSDNVLVHKEHVVEQKQHNYGGWHCPDNLYGFPAINIKDWENVSVVNNRMPSLEEAQNGESLIYVDPEEHPNAQVLPITMPRLAAIYSEYTHRNELIIVIQAFEVNQDSIVGFRYLNGGNGSAHLSEIKFKTKEEIDAMPEYKFVTKQIEINASPGAIWKTLTEKENAEELRKVFDPDKTLPEGWREKTNVNFAYANAGEPTAWFADMLWGSYYIQNDYTVNGYSEKFFLSENKESGKTELNIVCGPFLVDFNEKDEMLSTWGQKIKDLAEGC